MVVNQVLGQVLDQVLGQVLGQVQGQVLGNRLDIGPGDGQHYRAGVVPEKGLGLNLRPLP